MRSGFFENTDIFAEDFAAAFGGVISDGVLSADGMAVSAGGGMSVKVAVGRCWIKGHYGIVEEEEVLTIDAADSAMGRIDRVTAVLDKSAGKIYLTVRKGTPAADPQPPALTRNGTIHELCLCDIAVAAGASEITAAMLTDRRSDSTLCGGVNVKTAAALSLDGKADKTALEAAKVRITKNENDITALQNARMTPTVLYSGEGASSVTASRSGYNFYIASVKVRAKYTAYTAGAPNSVSYGNPEYLTFTVPAVSVGEYRQSAVCWVNTDSSTVMVRATVLLSVSDGAVSVSCAGDVFSSGASGVSSDASVTRLIGLL